MCNYVELEENKKEIRGAELRWRWGSTCRPHPHHYSLRRFRSAGVLSTPLRSPPRRRYLHLLVSTTSLSSSSRSPPRCYSLHSSLSLPSIAVLHLSLVFSASLPSSPLPRHLLRFLAVFSTPALCFPCHCCTHSLGFSPSLVFHVDRRHGFFCLVIQRSILTPSHLLTRWRWVLHTFVLVGFVSLSFLPSQAWVALVLCWSSPHHHSFPVAGVPCCRPSSP